MTTGQKQHVDVHRKVALRRTLLRKAFRDPPDGAAYVPFCGDGDLAAELNYLEQFSTVLAADIDPIRVATFKSRFPTATTVVADCDKSYPFPDDTPLAMADLDAYTYPFDALRVMLANVTLAHRFVLFLTDGSKQGIMRTGSYREPNGTEHGGGKIVKGERISERRSAANFWWPKYIRPQVRLMLAEHGFSHGDDMQYTRGMELYAGMIFDREA